MNKIEVKIIDQCMQPDAMMMFLAKLTQRGHKIVTMKDLDNLFYGCQNSANAVKHSGRESTYNQTLSNIAKLPHGTIKRFTPITIAVVGASRRFLAQARTHQVGFNFVSASLQYSDYSGSAQFVVPYALIKQGCDEQDNVTKETWGKPTVVGKYLDSCMASLAVYEGLIQLGIDNDTAGYAMPQGLRNILIMQANHESWAHFVQLRACQRNTDETRYVTTKIWDALLHSNKGEEMFEHIGPTCIPHNSCREGKMCCGNPFGECADPREILKRDWPLIWKGASK